jgi:hypothetical protein
MICVFCKREFTGPIFEGGCKDCYDKYNLELAIRTDGADEELLTRKQLRILLKAVRLLLLKDLGMRLDTDAVNKIIEEINEACIE